MPPSSLTWFSVGGFVFLAVMWILYILGNDNAGFDYTLWVLEAYYIFFALFMTAVVLRVPYVMEGCGFLWSVLPKSIFYIL